jgi:predicted phage terminase large subunit-like protein
MGKRANGRFVIADCVRGRWKSHKVRQIVKNTATHDGTGVKVGISQDPGQAGKEQAENYVALLTGFNVSVYRETGDKVVRADPFAAQWQAGAFDVVRGAWNEDLFGEYEAFPGTAHDDQVDAGSGAFSMLTKSRTIFDSL